jgi:bloom syndrome protein
MLPFRAKVKKYGDRVLATIEDFLSQHPNPRRNSSGSGSNEHTEAKKRRGFTASYAGSNAEDDFDERAVQSKKRAAKTRATKQGASVSDAASMVHGARCMDADLDGVEVLDLDDELCSTRKPVASGRVLPKWAPAKAKGGSVPPSNLFQEFSYVK